MLSSTHPLLIAGSCELVNLMAQLHIADAGKLGLSIFWGIYALGLIAIGIAWNKKHLRIAAIALLAVTLVKLFVYDVADLPTIPKTILFVSLGLLLLIISFLYNKYKALIFRARCRACRINISNLPRKKNYEKSEMPSNCLFDCRFSWAFCYSPKCREAQKSELRRHSREKAWCR